MQGDAVLDDAGPEILALAEAQVHLGHGVDDDVDDAADGRVALDAVLGHVPVVGRFRQLLVTDDDQDVEVGLVAGVRRIDPVLAGIGTEQDDLEDAAVATPGLGRAAAGVDGAVEFLEQDRLDPLQFALLPLGQVIQVDLHDLESSTGKRCGQSLGRGGASARKGEKSWLLSWPTPLARERLDTAAAIRADGDIYPEAEGFRKPPGCARGGIVRDS